MFQPFYQDHFFHSTEFFLSVKTLENTNKNKIGAKILTLCGHKRGISYLKLSHIIIYAVILTG